MKYRLVVLIPFLLTFNCNEVDRILLIRTELQSKSPTEIVVTGSILDIPDEVDILEYGHCWSERGYPTVADSATKFSSTPELFSKPFSYLSSITSFVGNRTYYVNTYVRFKNGSVRYGNTISVTSELTNGKWTKFAEHWYPTKVSSFMDDYTGCGPGSVAISTYQMFASILVSEERLFTHGGFTAHAGLTTYEGTACEQPGTSFLGFAQWENNVLRRYDNDQWAAQSLVQDASGGIGSIAISQNGLFYFGGGGKSISFNFDGFRQLYSTSEYSIGSGFFALDPQNNTSLPLNPSPLSKAFATTFVLGNKIYAIGGICGLGDNIERCEQDFAYDISSGEWEVISRFPGSALLHMTSFVLNGKAYVGGGFQSLMRPDDDNNKGDFPFDPSNEFYEYDQASDTWRNVSDFPGEARGASFHFDLNNYGYLGGGGKSLFDKFFKDFWRYDPIRDNWTQLDDFPGGRRFAASGAAVGSKGVVGFGIKIKDQEPDQIDPVGDWFFRVDQDVDFWIFDPSKM